MLNRLGYSYVWCSHLVGGLRMLRLPVLGRPSRNIVGVYTHLN